MMTSLPASTPLAPPRDQRDVHDIFTTLMHSPIPLGSVLGVMKDIRYQPLDPNIIGPVIGKRCASLYEAHALIQSPWDVIVESLRLDPHGPGAQQIMQSVARVVETCRPTQVNALCSYMERARIPCVDYPDIMAPVFSILKHRCVKAGQSHAFYKCFRAAVATSLACRATASEQWVFSNDEHIYKRYRIPGLKHSVRIFGSQDPGVAKEATGNSRLLPIEPFIADIVTNISDAIPPQHRLRALDAYAYESPAMDVDRRLARIITMIPADHPHAEVIYARTSRMIRAVYTEPKPDQQNHMHGMPSIIGLYQDHVVTQKEWDTWSKEQQLIRMTEMRPLPSKGVAHMAPHLAMRFLGNDHQRIIDFGIHQSGSSYGPFPAAWMTAMMEYRRIEESSSPYDIIHKDLLKDAIALYCLLATGRDPAHASMLFGHAQAQVYLGDISGSDGLLWALDLSNRIPSGYMDEAGYICPDVVWKAFLASSSGE
jgi:hypothetical protein